MAIGGRGLFVHMGNHARAAFAAFVAGAAPAAALAASVDHVIIIYEENRSFDAFFSNYPGAEGAASKNVAGTQIAPSGFPFSGLPPLLTPRDEETEAVDALRVPIGGFPNHWFYVEPHLDGNPRHGKTPDLIHRFYQEQAQINGGRMDRFAEISNAGGYVLAFNDLSGASSVPPQPPAFLWTLAREGVLYDHFFHAAFGGSFLNHQWLVAARTPAYDYAGDPAFPEPKAVEAVLDAGGKLVKDGSLTPKDPATGEVHAVNTVQSIYLHSRSVTAQARLLPPLRHKTIGDLLDAAGVRWAWYGEGYKDAAAGMPDPDFQFHHQPFAYFAVNAPAAPSAAQPALPPSWRGDAATEAHRVAHLKDNVDQPYLSALNPAFYADHRTVGTDDFFAALGTDAWGNRVVDARCTLESVAFYKPVGKANMHPGYGDIATGDERLRTLISAIRHSPCWNENTVVFVTFDENGGLWDHVAPPAAPEAGARADRWGPGSRVPAIMIASRLKDGAAGRVDSGGFDQTALLKLIETRFGLPPLSSRDAAQGDLLAGYLQ